MFACRPWSVRRSRLSPLQAKHSKQDAALGFSGLQDEDAAQNVEVQLVLWDGAEQPGLEEGGPLPLQGPLAAPVALHTQKMSRVLLMLI